MNKMKIYGIVAAFCLCSYFGWTSLAQPNATANTIPDPDNYSPNWHYDGLTLAFTPVELMGDEWMMTSLMDAKLWKFAAKVTKPKQHVVCDLEIREAGKPTKVLSSFDVLDFGWDGHKTQPYTYLYVGMLPLNADLNEATKLKCQIVTDGVTESQVVANPFKGASMQKTPNATEQPDIPLWGAQFDAPVHSGKHHDLTLCLKIITKPQP